MSVRLNVVAGNRREVVGSILAQPGMLTSEGRIERITPSGQVVTDTGRRIRDPKGLTVRHTESLKFGYPDAAGCRRQVVRHIRRGGETLAA